MTENIPPSSGTKPVAASDRPGLPYYEKLRRDLRDTLQKKRLLDRNLVSQISRPLMCKAHKKKASVEDQIYNQESRYLEETSAAGNIVKGFDSYIKSSAAQGGGAGTISGSAVGIGLGRRKAAVNDSDRVFSRSSVSYMRDSDSPSSATSTPGHANTPTGSFTAEKTGDKKKKKSTAGNDDDTDNKTDARSNKRQKITFGGRKSMHED
ncbi:hypothetical protein H2200_006158 [Cladophialophora chaetospira]|uniref:Chromatin modification-related protein EAF6 n=1 Tax=Cladophialophora chaetospira TaxID=386627 RepID=A0AA38XAE3_9EURO|nr:hypothetical protein H2200_006158 [Cladophialophora chaetospira]